LFAWPIATWIPRRKLPNLVDNRETPKLNSLTNRIGSRAASLEALRWAREGMIKGEGVEGET